jgi:hypothetical protein
MKRTIYLAFATLAFPFLAMAQSPDTPPAAPAPGEEKPVIPGAPAQPACRATRTHAHSWPAACASDSRACLA